MSEEEDRKNVRAALAALGYDVLCEESHPVPVAPGEEPLTFALFDIARHGHVVVRGTTVGTDAEVNERLHATLEHCMHTIVAHMRAN